MGVKLYVLSGGMLDGDRSVIHAGDDSHRRVSLPVMQLLVQADGANILVDTGVPPETADDNSALEREYGIEPAWIAPHLTPQERPDRQIALLGLQPSDLDMVINTHTHFDHAGGNRLFAGVPIAMQEAELASVRESDEASAWWDAPGLEFQSVRGDWSPVPGVEMLLTPGHTPGHQSMLVRLPSGPLLFTWDAVYTEEHWREDKLGVVQDVQQARRSMERLREIAREENTRVIFGHDIAQWEALGMMNRHAPLELT